MGIDGHTTLYPIYNVIIFDFRKPVDLLTVVVLVDMSPKMVKLSEPGRRG